MNTLVKNFNKSEDIINLTYLIFTLIKVPIRNMEIIYKYKRCFLVAIEPHASIDPIIPITYADMGQRYNTNVSEIFSLLHNWSVGINQERWGKQSLSILQLLISDLRDAQKDGKITGDECRFMTLAWKMLVSMPHLGKPTQKLPEWLLEE